MYPLFMELKQKNEKTVHATLRGLKGERQKAVDTFQSCAQR